MTKTSDAQLKAIKKYNSGSKYIQLKFTPNQIDDYNRIVDYCSQKGVSMQGYIKGLIKDDLEGNYEKNRIKY